MVCRQRISLARLVIAGFGGASYGNGAVLLVPYSAYKSNSTEPAIFGTVRLNVGTNGA